VTNHLYFYAVLIYFSLLKETYSLIEMIASAYRRHIGVSPRAAIKRTLESIQNATNSNKTWKRDPTYRQKTWFSGRTNKCHHRRDT